MKQRVEWQTYTLANQSGQPVASYQSQGTFWAAVEPLTGREAIIAQQRRADVTHKVTMYRVGAINPQDRLVYKTRIFEIVSVLNLDELNVGSAQLVLTCVEVIGGN